MDTLRILHCADFHIGMRFSDYNASEALREARRTAVDRVVEAAGRAECHLLTVSGDLFDRVSMSKADVSRTAAALSEFAGRAVLVLPGNHDYAGAESTLWRDFRDSAADHVHVLDRSEPFDLGAYGIPAVVYPAPCDAKHSEDNRIGYVAGQTHGTDSGTPSGSNTADGRRAWRIGMAHGSIEGVSPDFDGRYFPMRRNELENAGVDVWLLGHSHISWPQSLGDSPRILNPGTPEPDGFDCSHPGHAYVVTLESPENHETATGEQATLDRASLERAPLSVERITTGRYFFRREQRTLGAAEDVEALKRIADEDSAERMILRLELDGRLPPDALSALQDSVSILEAAVAELDLRHENVREAITRDRILEEYPEGSFASTLLLSFADAGDQEALETAWDIVEESRQ